MTGKRGIQENKDKKDSDQKSIPISGPAVVSLFKWVKNALLTYNAKQKPKPITGSREKDKEVAELARLFNVKIPQNKTPLGNTNALQEDTVNVRKNIARLEEMVVNVLKGKKWGLTDKMLSQTDEAGKNAIKSQLFPILSNPKKHYFGKIFIAVLNAIYQQPTLSSSLKYKNALGEALKELMDLEVMKPYKTQKMVGSLHGLRMSHASRRESRAASASQELKRAEVVNEEEWWNVDVRRAGTGESIAGASQPTTRESQIMVGVSQAAAAASPVTEVKKQSIEVEQKSPIEKLKKQLADVEINKCKKRSASCTAR
jgi:hypothetical protein